MPRQPGAAASLRRAAFAVNGVYLCLLVVGPDGHHLWRELGLQVAAIGSSAGYVWYLVAREAAHRAWRVPVALWITFFALANVVANAHTGPVQPAWSVVPSMLLYIPAYPCALVAVAVLFRGRLRPVRPGPLADAAVGALTIAALFAGFIVPAAVRAVRPDGLPVWLALVFPACDLLITAMVVAGIAVSGPERFSGWFVLGISFFGSADWWYVVQLSLGQWRTGTILDGIWVVGCAIVGLLAAPAPDRAGQAVGRTWSVAALAVPFVAATTSLAILVIGTRVHVPLAGVVLASAALLGVLTRLGVAYAAERRHVEVLRLARTDELTGVVNRRGLHEALDLELDGGRPFAVLLLDLDRFKEVNDTYGHAAGDVLIRDVADRLRRATPPDGLLARFGGDEFAVVVPCPGPDAAGSGERAARALVEALDEPFAVGAGGVRVSASIGSAVVVPGPAVALTHGDLLHHADLAMYEAKQSGSGVRVVVLGGPGAARPGGAPDALPAGGHAGPPAPWTVEGLSPEGSRPSRA